MLCFFFFKQKTAYEMRISDGVQTCALPISSCAKGADGPTCACAIVAHDAAASMAERIRCMKIGLLTMIDRGAPTRAQIGRQAWGGLKWTMPVRPSSDAEAAIVGLGIVRTWVYRSEEHTSELQSLMRISYAVFCLKKKTTTI